MASSRPTQDWNRMGMGQLDSNEYVWRSAYQLGAVAMALLSLWLWGPSDFLKSVLISSWRDER